MCFSPLGKGGGAGCWQQVVLAQHFRMTKSLKVKGWWNLIWAAVNCENALITDFSHCHGKRQHPSFQQQLYTSRSVLLSNSEMGVTGMWCSSHPLSPGWARTSWMQSAAGFLTSMEQCKSWNPPHETLWKATLRSFPQLLRFYSQFMDNSAHIILTLESGAHQCHISIWAAPSPAELS